MHHIKHKIELYGAIAVGDRTMVGQPIATNREVLPLTVCHVDEDGCPYVFSLTIALDPAGGVRLSAYSPNSTKEPIGVLSIDVPPAHLYAEPPFHGN